MRRASFATRAQAQAFSDAANVAFGFPRNLPVQFPDGRRAPAEMGYTSAYTYPRNSSGWGCDYTEALVERLRADVPETERAMLAGKVQLAEVNVLDRGADPTGSADSTAAFVSAASVGQLGVVRIPHGTYLVDPEAMNGRLVHWVGELNSPTTRTVIKSRSNGAAGKAVFSADYGRCVLENLVFDADSRCDYALRLYGSSQTILRNVEVRGAKVAGLYADHSLIHADQVQATSNTGHGIVVRHCNASVLLGCQGFSNGGVGLHVIGGAKTQADPPVAGEGDSGQMSVFGFWAGTNLGGQIRLTGAEYSFLSGLYIEGAGHGIKLEDGTHNCTIQNAVFISGGDSEARPKPDGQDEASVAVRLDGAHANLFSGLAISTGAYGKIQRRGTDLYNTIHHCNFASRVVPGAVSWETYT